MTLTSYIWELIINIVESSLLCIFLNDKLTSKTDFPFLAKLLYLLGIIVSTSLLSLFHIPIPIRFSLIFFICILFSAIFYSDSMSKKIIWTSIYFVICLSADSIVALIPQLFFSANTIATNAGGALRVPFTLLYIATIASFVFIFHYIKNNELSMTRFQRIIYILVCIIGFFFGEYITSITLESAEKFNDKSFTNNMILVCTIYISLFLLLLIFIYKLAYANALNIELTTKQQLFELEKKEFSNLIASTESLRQMKHELTLHLNTINYLLKESKVNDALGYIRQYLSVVDDSHHLPATGNTAIDCIISTTIPEAKSKGIHIRTSIFIPDLFPLDDLSTCALLGNLFTNSIEACMEQKASDTTIEPFIDFSIKPVQNMMLIKIDNSFNGEYKVDDQNHFLSRKRNFSKPGLGLKRIEEITAQFDGIIDINTNNNIFTISIMFPLVEGANEYRNN